MGIFQTIGQGYQIMGQEAKQNMVNNRSNIFTGVSVLGTIATGIVSALAGAKSARQIDAAAATMGRPLTAAEKAKLCWKNYIVPVGTTIGASAGAIGSRVTDAKMIAGLTQDVTMISRAYSEFKKASNEVLTERQQMEVKEKVAEKDREKISEEQLARVYAAPSPIGDVLFADDFSGLVWPSNKNKIELALAKCREEMNGLQPRNEQPFTPDILGVPFGTFLTWAGYFTSTGNGDVKDQAEIFKNYGWNKGDRTGSMNDDDPISCYLSPGERVYMGEMRPCYIIVWDVNPSDMRLGKYLKS